MTNAQLPVELRSGEILLQWYAPNLSTKLGIVALRSRPWVVLSMVGATFVMLPVVLILGVLHELLAVVGLAAMGAAVVAGFVVPVAFQWFFRPPVRWWVTSQRLMFGGRDPQQIELSTLDDIDVVSAHEIQITAGGASHSLRPVAAMPELWGSLVLGGALSPVRFPQMDADAPEALLTGAVCWNGVAKAGNASTTGVMVLRPGTVAWIPATTVTLGDRAAELGAALVGAVAGMRVRSIRPAIPTEALFHRLLRIADPDVFDDVIRQITERWGGFVLSHPDVMIRSRAQGDDVVLERDGIRYEGARVAHPDWADVRDALTRAAA